MRAGSVLESAQGNPKHQTAMSQVLIHEYLAELSRLKQASGSSRETIVREAFKDLLKGWGRAQDLVFLAEYPLKTATRANITVDGALLHHIRTPLGWWEAKDEDDDLDNEIAAKFRRGYPRDNIVFTDDVTAALWQGGNEAMRCSMTDTTQLEKLLKLFFAFERPEIAGFRRAVEQFKTDLPAVLKGLRDMIEAQHQRNAAFRAAQDAFLLHAQEAINPGLAAADVRKPRDVEPAGGRSGTRHLVARTASSSPGPRMCSVTMTWLTREWSTPRPTPKRCSPAFGREVERLSRNTDRQCLADQERAAQDPPSRDPVEALARDERPLPGPSTSCRRCPPLSAHPVLLRARVAANPSHPLTDRVAAKPAACRFRGDEVKRPKLVQLLGHHGGRHPSWDAGRAPFID